MGPGGEEAAIDQFVFKQQWMAANQPFNYIYSCIEKQHRRKCRTFSIFHDVSIANLLEAEGYFKSLNCFAGQ